jgi:UDP-hydrolysing UDP-N-acetyl-D-glucosamine 2-epimerase
MSKKKICVFIGSRANYSSIKSVMKAIQEHPALTLQLVVGASTLLDRYGAAVELIKKDGFIPDAEIYTLIEGETPITMAKSTGLGLLELPSIFARLEPDFVLTVGDRFETMATTLAAAYMNIPIAHTMGGEVSGTIDESIRHAVTKFAHVHFPASPGAAERIIKLGERPADVHLVGCPRIDLVADILSKETDFTSIEELLFSTGVGDKFPLSEPFILVSQHPVTTEYGEGELQISQTLEAVKSTGIPAIVLWPNADAGSEDIARGIRKWREKGLGIKMRFFTNLPVETYVHLMRNTCCLVGNSSSGIREGAFIGTPVVNVGSRQTMRERGDNVIEVPCDVEQIKTAILQQVANGRYKMNSIYGVGNAGKLIADILATKKVNIQKRICY